MKQKSNLARKMELFYQEIESKREGETLRLQIDLELRGSMGNITWTCSAPKLGVEKLLQPSKKSESSRSFFSRAKNCKSDQN